MPPARKRAPRATEDTAPNTEANGSGDEEGEGEDEDAPKAPRVRKTYEVKDAELANALVGDDHDEISEGDPATGEMLDSMRRNKAKWDSPEDGGIKHVFGSNSAIPLRKILQEWEAEQDEDSSLDIEDVDALYEALISGEGWVRLAARTGASQADVRAALKDKVMEEHDVDITEGGRAYGKGENWTWVSAEALAEAKEANGNGSDEEDEAEGDEEDDANDTEDEASTEEEAPAPRRRRRAPAA